MYARETRTVISVPLLVAALVAFAADGRNAMGQCACNCDVAAPFGGGCSGLDIVAVVDCIGMPPVGACTAMDVNCDGDIDNWDAESAVRGLSLFPLAVRCVPLLGPTMTYQGHLVFGGVVMDDICDFSFSLWDTFAGGTMVGPLQAVTLDVIDGVFTTQIALGTTSTADQPRWLEVAVVCPTGAGPLVPLAPRTELTPVPFAMRAVTGIGGPTDLNVGPNGNVGIGTAALTSFDLDVTGTIRATGVIFANNGISSASDISASRAGFPAASFNRTGSDGVIVNLQQDGVVEGTITVAGAVVTYTAFTGSHLGWTSQTLVKGTLVSLTGDNRRLHDRAESEIVYGIARSTTPNDPTLLGAYLAVQEPSQLVGPSNPHLVMAVGNGEVWISDGGRDISPGDWLIASDLAGHAMLDDPARFRVGHVIARAAEAVRWAEVTDTVDGIKHKRVSVLFDAFLRANYDESLVTELQRRLTALESKNEELTRREANIEPNEAPVSLAASAMVPGAIGLALLIAGGARGWYLGRARKAGER